MFIFAAFEKEYPFWVEIGSNSSMSTISSILNLMVMCSIAIFDQNHLVWGNLVQKIKIFHSNRKLVIFLIFDQIPLVWVNLVQTI